MRNIIYFFILLVNYISFSCKKKIPKSEVLRIGTEICARQPLFLRNIGFDPLRSAFSTTQNNSNGIVLLEIPLNMSDSSKIKTYQHESWKRNGWMGSITSGEDGTTYTVPVPKINTLDRPLSKMNKIYKISPFNGEMVEFINLPAADTTSKVVPFGVLGLYFDCHGKRIFASSVAGSTRNSENGIIYSIDPKTAEVKDKLSGFDAMGLFVAGITGEKILYFGSARKPIIYGIELDAEGNFVGKPEIKLSLQNLGPRGDDKARRIRLNKNGLLEVYGVEFNYNLVANTTVPQSFYQFEFDINKDKWEFRSVRN